MVRHSVPKLNCPILEVTFQVKHVVSHADYKAEIYVDSNCEPPIYHFVVTRKDSTEVLMYGQTRTLEEARRAAYGWMKQFGGDGVAAG